MAVKQGPITSRMIEELARRSNISYEQTVEQLLKHPAYVSCPLNKGQDFEYVVSIPGHAVGEPCREVERGPRPAKVMIILSHPNYADSRFQAYLSDESGREFRNAVVAGGEDPGSWYVTAVVKYSYPQNRSTPLAAWTKECAPLLAEEIRRVDPDYILLMGSYAVKAVLPEQKFSNLRGRVQVLGKAKVFVASSPHALAVDPSTTAEFYGEIADFCRLVRGGNPVRTDEIDIELLETPEAVADWVDRNMSQTFFSVDCEWGGPHPDRGGLRTIQISAQPGKVAVLYLRDAGWPMPVVLEEQAIVAPLNRLFDRPEARITGHFFRSDALYLEYLGVRVMDAFMRGVDTILLYHALYPERSSQLEIMASHLLKTHRYDEQLRAWTDGHKKLVDRYAYAHVPKEILVYYGAHDADKTWKCCAQLMAEISQPGEHYKKLRGLVFKVTMPAGRGIFEMEQSGLRVDMQRFSFLEMRFKERAEELLTEIRTDLKWEDFNPRSYEQKIDLLFGERYHKKRDEFGRPRQLRPSWVPCLGLVPEKTTGKQPKLWADVVEDHDEDKYTPSTDNETLGMLAAEHPIVSKIRDYGYLSKIISTMMPEPVVVKGQPYYFKGLRSWAWHDNTVHTHISQLAETGRWKSFDPNNQNLPSQREKDFKRIFDDPQWPKVKSIFVGDEDLPVLIESDYITAEVFSLAFLSGDEAMLEILLNPKRDIHSEMAVKMFKLRYDPACGVGTKKWIAGQYSPVAGRVDKVVELPNNRGHEVWLAGQKIVTWPGLALAVREGTEVLRDQLLTESLSHLRTSSKTIIFGIPYQRGAKAVARQLSQDGVPATVQEAQSYIDEYLTGFFRAAEFLERCKEAVFEPGVLWSPYGRMRRFNAESKKVATIRAQQREACNWPVQNLVAEALSVAVAKLFEAHRWSRCPFRIKLAVHDSTLIACRGQDAPYIIEEVIQPCMGSLNIVPGLNFHFGVESTMHLRYSEKASREELKEAGVPEGYEAPVMWASRGSTVSRNVA
ncbi:MAG: DNA polymerase [Acholeplasmataceae bacterium]